MSSECFTTVSLVFATAEQAGEVAEAVSQFDGQQSTVHAFLTPLTSEKTEVDGCTQDGRFVEISISEPGDLSLDAVAEAFEDAGAEVVTVERFHESEPEDVEGIYRKKGKKTRQSAVFRAIESAAPAYKAHYLLSDRNLAGLEKMLKQGLDPDAMPYKHSLLYNALCCANRVPDAAQLLLRYGADPNLTSCFLCWEPADGPLEVNDFDLPLMAAIGRSRSMQPDAIGTELVRQLLDAGADPNRVSPRSLSTPIAEAADFGALDVVELLLEAGADANGKAHYKNNDIAAISLAAYRFRENPEHPSETHLAIMRVLLRHGADESVQGPDGQVLGRARTLYPEIDTPA